MSEARAAGDPLPAGCRPLEIRVAELKQLFNAMDPSPFREKDLDPHAEEFIVGWARELPAGGDLIAAALDGRVPASTSSAEGTPSAKESG